MSGFVKGKRKSAKGADEEEGIVNGRVVDTELEFEDPFGDDYEDEEIVDEDGNEGEERGVDGDVDPDAMDGSDSMSRHPHRARVYKPAEGEELEFDPSAYVTYHALSTEWPCLSFDILKDSLGDSRNRFPLTMFLVSGSQADRSDKNCLTLLKLSDLCKTQQLDEDDSDGSDDDDAEDDPVLEHTNIPHIGGVNRVRAMPQNSGILATMADTGSVNIFDISSLFLQMQNKVGPTVPPQSRIGPMFTIKEHAVEGFAIDWSTVMVGRLITGDCSGAIRLTNGVVDGNGALTGWKVDGTSYLGHTASVEDLQWSPNEATVFASASADSTVKIWDIRGKSGPQLNIDAHPADVNVISWNKNVGYLLASGSDDGSFKVWDLRTVGRSSNEPLAHFRYHEAPITSIEWAAHDESLLAVSSEDHQVTIWDLSVEADVGEGEHTENEFPPQLLFVHQGQRNVKEVHFHPQIPGLLVSTAEDGFNVFKPAINAGE